MELALVAGDFCQIGEGAPDLYGAGWVANYPDPKNLLDLLFHSEARDARYISQAFDRIVEQARLEQRTEDRHALC